MIQLLDPGPALQRLLPGAGSAVLLGGGAASWLSVAAGARAAAVGTTVMPALEKAMVAAALGLGLWLGAVTRSARGRVLAAALLVVGAVIGCAAEEWLDGDVAAGTAGALPTVVLPMACCGWLGGALLAASGARGGQLLGWLVAGVIAASAAAPWLQVGGPAPLRGAAALALLGAAALVPLGGADRPREARRAERALGVGAAIVVGALAVGAAARAWPQQQATSALAAGFVLLGLLLGRTMHEGSWARLVALLVLLAVLATNGASAHGTAGYEAFVALACGGGLLGVAAASLPAVELIAGVAGGALMVVVAAATGLSTAAAAAAVAVAGGLLLRRVSALAWSLVLGAPLAVLLAVAIPSGRGPAPFERLLMVRGATAVDYLERTQQLRLRHRDRVRDVTGPMDAAAGLAAALVCALLPERARTVLVDGGMGPVAGALVAVGRAPALLVDEDAELQRAAARLRCVGPVEPSAEDVRSRAPRDGATATWLGGTRRLLGELVPGRADALICAAPLLAGRPWQASFELHAAMRKAVGAGLVLQSFSLAATPPALLASALAVAREVHPWCGVFVVGDAGVIVGSGRLPPWSAASARLAALGAQERWPLGAVGVGDGADLQRALLGRLTAPGPAASATVLTAPSAARGEEHVAANAAVLRDALAADLPPGCIAELRLRLRSDADAERIAALAALTGLILRHPDSALLWQECQRARTELVAARVAAMDPASPADVAAAAELAARLAHEGARHPFLQAAMGLPDRHGSRARGVRAAGLAAVALDPGLCADAPPVLRPVLQGVPAQSPLADWAFLPEPPRLLELAVGYGPTATALRARFPAACAAALVAAWQRGPLDADQRSALRELADPFVLTAAARVLAARGAVAEVLQVFRRDLPTPTPLLTLLEADADTRVALLVTIAGRRDVNALEALARGLVDPEAAVREAAGAALFRSVGEHIAYDPEWSPERRRAVAAKVRDLQKRIP